MWQLQLVIHSSTAFGTNVFDGLALAGGNEAEPTSDNHWIIEFTSGAYTGLVKQVTAFSGSRVTVAGGLPVIDARELASSSVKITPLDHSSVMQIRADVVTKVRSHIWLNGSGSADVISVLNSSGQWVKYFYRAGYRLEAHHRS